jgi:hypothetical protein
MSAALTSPRNAGAAEAGEGAPKLCLPGGGLSYQQDLAQGRKEARRYIVEMQRLIRLGCGYASASDLRYNIARLRRQIDYGSGFYGYAGFFTMWRAKLDSDIAWARKQLGGRLAA